MQSVVLHVFGGEQSASESTPDIVHPRPDDRSLQVGRQPESSQNLIPHIHGTYVRLSVTCVRSVVTPSAFVFFTVSHMQLVVRDVFRKAGITRESSAVDTAARAHHCDVQIGRQSESAEDILSDVHGGYLTSTYFRSQHNSVSLVVLFLQI